MKLFVLIACLSAWLVFQVQPMLGKALLPYLGGSAQVWNSALMCFQFLLFLGYGYSFLLSRYFSLRGQWVVHAAFALLVLAASMPLALSHFQAMPPHTSPVGWVIHTVLLHVGAPFVLLAATAPLIQYWFSRTWHGQSPYPLYSASNLGSVAALLSYPLVVERLFDLDRQAEIWSAVFAVFVLSLCGLIGYLFKKTSRKTAAETQKTRITTTWNTRILWLIASFLPCSLMMGLTSYITTDLASIPLLWIIPLLLYLLSIIIVFSEKMLKFCDFAVGSAPVSILFLGLFFYFDVPFSLMVMALHFAVFFMLSVAVHAMLFAHRPKAEGIADFYVCMSAGGALGGIFNVFIVQYLFPTDVLEYPWIFLACGFFLAWASPQPFYGISFKRGVGLWVAILLLYLLCMYMLPKHLSFAEAIDNFALKMNDSKIQMIPLLVALLLALVQVWRAQPLKMMLACAMLTVLGTLPIVESHAFVFTLRNFFGIYRVAESFEPDGSALRAAYHNTTLHGAQSSSTSYGLQLSTYYWPLEVLRSLPKDIYTKPAAMVGLGVGTTLCAFQEGNAVDVFELDPDVETLAGNTRFFTYFTQCLPKKRVIIGDARLMLQKQPMRKYGIMILDAFSSDSIPTHLLTEEAIDMYFDRMVEGGIIFFHTSNRYLDLKSVLARYAQSKGYAAFFAPFSAGKALPNRPKRFATNWVVIVKRAADAEALIKSSPRFRPAIDNKNTTLWTDRYSNIFAVLR